METDDKSPAAEERGGDGGVVELPAPDGWKKKFTLKKSSRRNDILFISPTGDEIRSKSQLDKYLKSHPGGPSASEFDWSTGETPRRSGRISGKVKATEAPEIEPPSKRFSAKKDSLVRKQNMDIENKDIGNDKDALVEKENEESEEVEKTDDRVAAENNAPNSVLEEPMQPVTEETVADVSKKEQADDHVDKPIEETTDSRVAAENNAPNSVLEEPMQPVTEETVAADVSKKEQTGDHVDKPIEEITDSGAENRLAEPEAKPETEGGEVNAGMDVNEEDSSLKVETQLAENPQPEIKVADNTRAESKSELPD